MNLEEVKPINFGLNASSAEVSLSAHGSRVCCVGQCIAFVSWKLDTIHRSALQVAS